MSEEKRTPLAWAERKGLFRASRFAWEAPSVDQRWAPSDALYGWSEQAYQHQAPEQAFLISENDFEKALEAAFQYPAVPPHAPAIAPIYQQRFPELFQAEPEPAPAPDTVPETSNEE